MLQTVRTANTTKAAITTAIAASKPAESSGRSYSSNVATKLSAQTSAARTITSIAIWTMVSRWCSLRSLILRASSLTRLICSGLDKSTSLKALRRSRIIAACPSIRHSGILRSRRMMILFMKATNIKNTPNDPIQGRRRERLNVAAIASKSITTEYATNTKRDVFSRRFKTGHAAWKLSRRVSRLSSSFFVFSQTAK